MTSTSRTAARNGAKMPGSLTAEKFLPEDASINNGRVFESAVVRARYELDVGGVNRYKHTFRSLAPSPHDCNGSHSSLSSNGVVRSNGGGGGGCSGESIDRKPKSKPVSPRARSPAILNTGRKSPGGLSTSGGHLLDNVEGVALPTIVGVACGSGSGKAAPLVDTWRVRRHRRLSPRLNVIVHSDGKTPSVVSPNSSRSPNSPSTLPAISSQMRTLTSMIEGALTSATGSPTSGQQAVLARHRFIPPPSPTAPTPADSNAMRESKSHNEEMDGGSRFHFPKIALKRAGLEDLINRESQATQGGNRERAGVGKRKPAAPPPPVTVGNGFLPQSPSTHLKPPIDARRGKRELGTQTESSTDALPMPQSLEPPLEPPLKPVFNIRPTLSTPPSVHQPTEKATPKATQTEQLNAFFSRAHPLKSYEYEVEEMEQRTALLELIDSALGETIDKTSRERTNQLIASTARKQAQVWRDVKEFMTSVLLPCSVDMANSARSVAINLETIANIQLP